MKLSLLMDKESDKDQFWSSFENTSPLRHQIESRNFSSMNHGFMTKRWKKFNAELKESSSSFSQPDSVKSGKSASRISHKF